MKKFLSLDLKTIIIIFVNNIVYIVIDQDMHSYESILGIYDTFEGAMNCNAWSNRGITPDKNGSGAVERIAGLWSNTAVITSITAARDSGNYNAGTIATLYGIL
jgi:hypothetical protein